MTTSTVRGSSRRGVPGVGRRFAGSAALLLLAASLAGAQSITFGKNKVNYREFDWSVFKGAHVHLYSYPEEDSLARIALAFAEKSYTRLSARFVHEIDDPIPIILYGSHHDFEQTNITPMIIPEGVAGMTESMRGRVLIPFDGSFQRFTQTLQHELVHVFQRSMDARLFHERIKRRVPSPPLWFSEGLAEHWSSEWDADGDMILRDLVITGRLPGLGDFGRHAGTFTMYKLGQSVLDYIGRTYGEDKIAQFYTEAWKVRKFEDLYSRVLGVSESELSAGWMYMTKRRYYPDVSSARPLLQQARVVGDGPMVLKPVPVPPGVKGFDEDYIYISPHTGYATIYAADLGEGDRDKPRKVVGGQQQPAYLSFHAFDSRMDVSPQGILIFSSHAGERDQLNAYSLTRGRAIAHWGFVELVGITSPQWDAEGRRVVFSGLSRDGRRDLYVFDAAEGKLTALTADRFSDSEPSVNPDGRRVAFVSDRGTDGRHDIRNLFVLDTETGEIRQLTEGAHWDLSPSWSPDGKRLLFTSTRGGRRDLYVMDASGNGARLTHSIEAILDPRWLPGGDRILASVFADGRFRAVVLPVPTPTAADSFSRAPTPAVAQWRWEAPADSAVATHEKYKSRFALDIAQGGVAVDPSLGSGEGLQVLLRDMMGNRLLFFQLGNTTISTRDFFSNLSGGVSYLDLSRRLNRGVSVYHHAGDYLDVLGDRFFERRAGVNGVLSYPFSRFMRTETSLGLAYSEKDKPSADFRRAGVLAAHYLSWIYDTSLWKSTGPLDGMRAHVTAGITMNLKRPGIESWLLLADARRYLRLGQQSALALRLQARLSDGPDPQGFVLGGTNSLRGYPWREFHGTRAILANVELRFPLLRGLQIDPIGVGPVSFPGVEAAVFADGGQAWYDDWPRGLLGSYGMGLRMGLGGIMVLRLDMARRTDFHFWPKDAHTEFSVGWNY